MSATEVANLIIVLFGKMKLEMLELLVKKLGYTKIAKAAGVQPGSISSALNRESLGDELAFKIFKGVAQYYPEDLKVALEVVLNRHKELYSKLGINIEELVKKKIEEMQSK